MKLESQLVHFESAPEDPYSPIATPIYQTTTFRQQSASEFGAFDYTRSGNPTRSVLERQLAKLEAGKHAFAFASGMAAISSLMSLLEPGDEVGACDDLYGGTFRYLRQVAPKQGIRTRFLDTSNLKTLESSLTEKVRLLLVETPTNPLQRISDLRRLAQLAQQRGFLLAVDNSLMSPMLQRPLLCGADLVVHSATKYLSGHSDVIAGVVVTRSDRIAEKLGFYQNAVGTALAPFDSWLLLRGMKTLALRVQRQQDNASLIARYLIQHPRGLRVHYPALPSHPGSETHLAQAKGGGGVVSFETGSEVLSRQIVEGTRFFDVTVSFGGVGSSIGMPALMSHASIPADAAEIRKVPRDLVRISVGIEHPDDLLEDLERSADWQADRRVGSDRSLL